MPSAFGQTSPPRPVYRSVTRIAGAGGRVSHGTGTRNRGAGGRNGGIVVRNGVGDSRTRALVPLRIHGGDRNAVVSASRQPCELEADFFVCCRYRARARDLNEGATRTRRIEYAVVHTKESQVCQRAPIGIRDGYGPRHAEGAGVARSGRQEDPTQRQSNHAKPANTP